MDGGMVKEVNPHLYVYQCYVLCPTNPPLLNSWWELSEFDWRQCLNSSLAKPDQSAYCVLYHLGMQLSRDYVRHQFVDFWFLIRCFPCAQCGRAGITIIQPTAISHERSRQAWWQDDRCSLSAIVHGFFWMLCTRQSCLLALRSSLCSWCLSLVCLMSLICAIEIMNSIAENPCGRSMRN